MSRPPRVASCLGWVGGWGLLQQGLSCRRHFLPGVARTQLARAGASEQAVQLWPGCGATRRPAVVGLGHLISSQQLPGRADPPSRCHLGDSLPPSHLSLRISCSDLLVLSPGSCLSIRSCGSPTPRKGRDGAQRCQPPKPQALRSGTSCSSPAKSPSGGEEPSWDGKGQTHTRTQSHRHTPMNSPTQSQPPGLCSFRESPQNELRRWSPERVAFLLYFPFPGLLSSRQRCSGVPGPISVAGSGWPSAEGGVPASSDGNQGPLPSAPRVLLQQSFFFFFLPPSHNTASFHLLVAQIPAGSGPIL